MTRAAVSAAALLALGLAQMVAQGVGLRALAAIAGAAQASPAPRLFSASRGLETFSTASALEWTDRRGGLHSLAITPELSARLRGPYSRRSVYGAALASGPLLATDPHTRALFDAVLSGALCGGAPLLRELGVDPADLAGPPRVRLTPRAGAEPTALPLAFEPACP